MSPLDKTFLDFGAETCQALPLCAGGHHIAEFNGVGGARQAATWAESPNMEVNV